MFYMRISGNLSCTLFFLTLLTLLLTGCQQNNDDAQPKTIADVILEDSNFTILRTAITHGGMSDALKGGNLTLFAPNDAAFRASGFADPAAIMALPAETVQKLVQYHVLGSPVSAANVPTGTNTPVVTAGGATAFITKTANLLAINGVKISETDQLAANGTIHTIDRVLNPSAGNLLAVAQAQGLTLLAAAATRAAAANPALLTSLTSPNVFITVFAPSDAAFRAAGYTEASINSANAQTLTSLLTYHAVPGVLFSSQFQSGPLNTLLSNNRLTITASTAGVAVKGNKNSTSTLIRTADIPTSNGVVHIIDQVLMP